jgi:hypothetical protein
MHLFFTIDDIGSLNRDFFDPDPVSRFQYQKNARGQKRFGGAAG